MPAEMAKEAESRSTSHGAGLAASLKATTNGVAHVRASSNSSSLATTSVTTTNNTAFEVNEQVSRAIASTVSRYASVGARTNILHERTLKATTQLRSQLGSFSETILESAPTFDDFLYALAAERLRYLPHDGSKWDKALRWAEGFSGHIHMFHEAVEGFMNNSVGASQLIWGSCLSLLQMGPAHVDMITKAFSLFHRLSLTMHFFLSQANFSLTSPEIRRQLAYAFSDLMELTCAVNAHYRQIAHTEAQIDVSDFDEKFSGLIASFYAHKDNIFRAVWSSEIERLDVYEDEVDIVNIRRFLEPHDRVLKRVLSRREVFDYSRAEFTCEWIERTVADFTRGSNKMLLVTGGPSSGKTVLSGWIAEHLQGSLENYPYSVLYYTFDKNIPFSCSSLSVVKSLLLQALERYLGNGNIISLLQEAIGLASKGQLGRAEETLWNALQSAVSLSKTVIILDGVDHVKADHHSKADIALLSRLQAVCSQAKTGEVKAIVLCRPLTHAAPPLTQHISIELEHITGDIRRVILGSFSSYRQFEDMPDDNKKTIAQLIAEKSHGSFLWADLAFALARHERDLSTIKQTIEGLPRNLDDLIDLHVTKSIGNKIVSHSILAWILASERPLLISEIKALLEVDTTEGKYAPRYTEIHEEIVKACGSLVVVDGEFAFLRHPDIRHHICSTKSKKHSFHVKEAHQDLLLRCLTYVKVCVHIDTALSHELMKEDAMYNLFDRYELLEYCTGYWIRHFQSSALYEEHGKHHLNAHFKASFPHSNTLALLEGSYGFWAPPTHTAKSLYHLAYNVRKLALGERSVSTLQSLINVVWVWRAHEAEEKAVRQKELEELWVLSFEAWKLSKSLANIRISLKCAEVFVESFHVESFHVEITKRTELVNHKEQCLQYIIKEYKHSHGVSHALTMKYTRSLAELYVSTHEHEKALVLYREMYEITVEHYGYFHEETTQMYDHLVKQLKKFSKFEIILEIVRNYHEHVTRTLSVTDERRWKSTQALIQIYAERGEVARAEESLLSFWRVVSKTEITDELIFERKVSVAVEYSQFLTRYERKDECLVILQGVWAEIEKRQEFFHSEICVQSLKLIAEEFKSIKAYSFARSVYTSQLSHYEKRKEQTSTVAIDIATRLAETITEVATSSSTTTHQSEVILTTAEEYTLQEVLQTTLKQSSTTISSTTTKTCIALATSYAAQKQWSRATEVYSQTISKAWSSIETSEDVKELTVEAHSEVVEVALNLASTRIETLQIDRAQRIYLNLFRSLIRMPACTQGFFSKIFVKVIEFFEKTYQFDKALEIYKESFVYLQTKFGKNHAYVIQVLRSYGSLAKRLGKWREIEQAYRFIFLAHKSDDGYCAIEGIDTALELCEVYERDDRWEDARSVYACLWQTYVAKGKEYGLEQKAIEKIYEKYSYILQHKTRVDASTVRKVAIEYRDTCKNFYGSHSELTLKATMQLAQVCERYDEYRQESVSYYEEVVKTTTSVTSTTTSSVTSISNSVVYKSISQQVKSKLAHLYSSSTTTVSKSISLYTEQLEAYKSEYGYSSKETLSVIHGLVLAYKKQETKEAITKATHILKSSVVEIFQHSTNSQVAIETAQTIARSYLSAGLKETAVAVVQELRHKIVEEARSSKVSEERFSSAFLAAFAEVVIGVSFSEFIADIKIEILLYQSYFRAVRTQKQVLTIIERGCQLRSFLRETKRETEFIEIHEEMFQIFTKHVNVSSFVTKATIEKFYYACLEDVFSDDSTRIIVEKMTQSVLECTNSSKFQEAYELVLLIDRFIHLQGGYRHQYFILQGFKLALYLSGRHTKICGDVKLRGSMLELAKIVLRESLEGFRKLKLSFTELDMHLVNDLVAILGEQGDLVELEIILSELWSSRLIQKKWGDDIVFSIGRRLIETRFQRGRHDEAIHLCNDVCYNLRRVYGDLDALTLEFLSLLSRLYTEKSRHQKAAVVHEEILRAIIDDFQGSQEKTLDVNEATRVASEHVELLRHALHRHGSKHNELGHKSLLEELHRLFGKEKLWIEHAPTPLTHPPAKEAGKVGAWYAPAHWGFNLEGLTVPKKRTKPLILKQRGVSWASYNNSRAASPVPSLDIMISGN